jgi:electron transport complex protein RnfG
MFVARRAGRLVGFVVESTTRGYKNRIRFMVGIAPDFTIAGVRVLEHEEDPGLGAEVATPEFQGQFIGRSEAGLDVTRDPMPEDWRVALAELRRMPPAAWRERHADRIGRERLRPVYAVTGATISSRALTEGVREALDHFRQRWTLIEPHLGGAS